MTELASIRGTQSRAFVQSISHTLPPSTTSAWTGTANMMVVHFVEERILTESAEEQEDNIWNATIVAAIHRDSVGATHRGSAGFYSECACCSTTTTTSPPVRSGPAAASIEEPLWSDFLCVASATGVDRPGLVSALRFDWCGKNWLDSSSSRNR